MVKNTLKSSRWLMIALLAVIFFAIPCLTAEGSHAADPSITTDKTYYRTTDPIYVTASGPASSGEWIGLYKYDGDTPGDVNSIYWYNVSEANGVQKDITTGEKGDRSEFYKDASSGVKLPVGKYYIYYFKNNGYDYYNVGATIWVMDFKTDKTSYSCGEAIKVYLDYSWSSSSVVEWVALYKRSDTPADGNSIYWYYLLDEHGYSSQGKWENILSRMESDTSRYGPGDYKLVVFEDSGHSKPMYSINLTITNTHTYTHRSETTKNPTCVSTGEKTWYCLCGAANPTKETVAASGVHDYSGQTASVTAGNCQDAKITKTKCKYCTYVKTETGSKDSTNHKSKVTDAAVAATCTQTGLTEGSHCGDCGATIVAQKTVSKTDHDYTGQTAQVTQTANCQDVEKTKTKCKNCDYYKEDTGTTNKNVHKSEVVDQAVAATCETTGLSEGKHCSACNAVITAQQTISALKHDWNAGERTLEPTCENEGTLKKTCQRAGCGKIEEEPIAALKHNWNDGEQTTAPKCEVAGVMTYTCQRDGSHTKTEPIAALPHLMNNGVQTIDPTCEGVGEMTYSCTRPGCLYSYTESIRELGHEAGEPATCTEDQTCIRCTHKFADMLGHDWVDANCTEAKHCERPGCGVAEGDPLGHAMLPATCHEPSKCNREGCTHAEGTVLEHQWQDADCDTPIQCSLCFDTVQDSQLGHQWGADATCTSAKVCTRPGCSSVETPALGHQVRPATCTVEDACLRAGCTTYYPEHPGGKDHEIVLATCIVAEHCQVCDETYGDPLGHDYVEGSCYNNTARTCKSCYRTDGAPVGHTPGEAATCTTAQTCTVCGIEIKGAKGHSLPANAVPTCSNSVICTACPAVLSPATGIHAWSKATCTSPQECAVCHNTRGEALGHSWLDATCTTVKTCDTCGAKEGSALGHKESGNATCTTSKVCTTCNEVLEAASGHAPGAPATCTADQTCLTCQMVLVAASGHREEVLPGIPATCTSDGISDGKICSKCQEVLMPQAGVSKLPHTADSVKTTKATTKVDGKIVKTCACGAVVSEETIYKVTYAKLSITNAVYNGKKKTPSLTVKDSQGNLLKKNRDYTVSFPKYRTNVGKYVYKITFKGNYSGTKSLTMTIKPVKTTIKKPAAAKKAVTVKWKKVSKQATGYQVMVATNKAFTKNVKKAFVTKKKTTSKKMTKLKANKKYYVRVRTYKTVKGVKIYSAWSAVKTVKTK